MRWIPRARGELTRAELFALSRADDGDPDALRAEIERETGWPHAALVPSARAGIVAALEALGVPRGAEVIVSALNFGPLVERLRERFVPVIADVRGTSACPLAVRDAITPRTRAILATHAFGRPAPMGAYVSLARRHGLVVVEDAAQALGCRPDARGDAAVFSFGPTKPLAGWGGGAVVTRDRELARRVRAHLTPGRGRAARLARGVAFEMGSRLGGPIARSGVADGFIERYLSDPAGALRARPWHDAPMGPTEARLVRMRIGDLAGQTRARLEAHARLTAELLSRGVNAWPAARGGIGFGVLVEAEDAAASARVLRRGGVDAPHGELRNVGDPRRHPRASLRERTLLRVPVVA